MPVQFQFCGLCNFSIQYGSKTETGNGSRIFSDDMHISESNMLKPDGIQLTPVIHQ